jgi:hypothetical protein
MVVALALAVIVGIITYRLRPSPRVTIGVEGQRIAEIAGPQLIAAPFTPGDALSVRIAGMEAIENGFRYDLRYMTFGPGEHDIGQSLVRPDGKHPEPQPEFAVSVAALIPEKYSGELYATPTGRIDLHSSYTFLMTLAWCGWALLLIPLIVYGFPRRQHLTAAQSQASIADRLRSLLEQAARTDLTVHEQADLEQLLLAFWSERLNLSAQRLSDAIEQLRHHPQAGPQWTSVERWLHSRRAPSNRATANELLSALESLE